MEIRVESLDFTQPLRASVPRVANKTLVFPRNVVSTVAGMTGSSPIWSATGSRSHEFSTCACRRPLASQRDMLKSNWSATRRLPLISIPLLVVGSVAKGPVAMLAVLHVLVTDESGASVDASELVGDLGLNRFPVFIRTRRELWGFR